MSRQLTHNTKAYVWSGTKRCKRCGFSNTWFVRKWNKPGRTNKRVNTKQTLLNMCRDCYNELRVAKHKPAGEREREYQRQYRERHREAIREDNRARMRAHRAKKKIKKLQETNWGRTLK